MDVSTREMPERRGVPLETIRRGGDHPDIDVALAHGTLSFRDDDVFWRGDRITLTKKQVDVLRCIAEVYPRSAQISRICVKFYGCSTPTETNTLRAHLMYLRRRMGPILLTHPQTLLGRVSLNPVFEYRSRDTSKPWWRATVDLASDDLWDDFRL